MPKVLIDAHMLGEQEGGNETYIAGLLKGFGCLAAENPFSVAVAYNPSHTLEQTAYPLIQPLHFSSNSNVRRLFIETPALCKAHGADLFHATYNISPLLKTPAVIAVHDIIFRLYPQYFSPRVRVLLSTLMPLSMWRAKAVITISEASKQDILRYYPFVRNKIVVTYLAAGPLVEATAELAAVQKYLNPNGFILAVGNVQPRKNLVRLVQSYILLRQRQATSATLVIVGRSQWQGSEIQKLASDSAYGQDIIFTGYLNDAAVAALYKHCTVFIYPSLYEGFGLPVLEAMALGAPVITSRISSLPEVAGDAALLVDPYSVEQLSDALERVLHDQTLREDLRRRGLRQATRFTWQKTALATLQVYRRALQLH